MKDYKAKCGNTVKISMVRDKLKVGGKTINPEFSSNNLNLLSTLQDMKPVNKDTFSIIQIDIDQNKFTGYACKVSSYEEACTAHSSLFQLTDFALATHRIYAYSFEGQDGHDDDGKFSASKQILQCLKEKDITNYYVCIMRHYGRNMGKKRFQVYKDIASQSLCSFFPELA